MGIRLAVGLVVVVVLVYDRTKSFFQSIHGDREQCDREQALLDLKTGNCSILIATDIASRFVCFESNISRSKVSCCPHQTSRERNFLWKFRCLSAFDLASTLVALCRN